MRVRIRVMALALSLLGTVLLSGCEPSGTRSSEQHWRDDLVPLVRPLPLVKMAEPLVIDFDVPPRPRHASPALFLGIRVADQSGFRSYEVADAIRHEPFPARVRLKRVDDPTPVATPLLRIEQVGSTHRPYSVVAVSADGSVPGVRHGDVDYVSVEAAGLDGAPLRHTYLQFAWAPEIAPGRYQLQLQLLSPPVGAAQFNAELMVAYARKGK